MAGQLAMATCDLVDNISHARAILQFVETLPWWLTFGLLGCGMHRMFAALWLLLIESSIFICSLPVVLWWRLPKRQAQLWLREIASSAFLWQWC